MDRANLLLQKVMGNNYFSAVLTLFLVLYAAMARPQLPPFIASLFGSPLFRFVVFALIAYMSSKDLTVAVMVAVAFVVTMGLLHEQKVAEGFMAGIQEGMIGDGTEDLVSQNGGYDATDDEISSLDK